MADDVVITGLGVISPIGCGEEAFWDSLCEGRSGAVAVDTFDTSDLPRKVACLVRADLDVGKPMGRAARLAVTASRQAIASARLDPRDVETHRLSIVIGTTMGETEFIESRLDAPDQHWLTSEHLQEIARGKPGSIAANVQSDLGVPGPATDLYGACAAGNLAIEAARSDLLEGRCDLALAGGVDGFSRLAFIGFMRLRVMAADICMPFDEKRDGLLVGEGAAVFILERESTARARGAPVRARIIGGAITCEAYHPTRPHPDGDGLGRATMLALDDAGLNPSDVDYVCAHGTGTLQNDAIEVKAMQSCLPDGVSFSSIKALTGHTMGAAAAMETACCVLSIEHQTLIPTWHLDRVLQPCTLDAIRGATRSARLNYTLNNSAGFGGYNSSLIIAAA